MYFKNIVFCLKIYSVVFFCELTGYVHQVQPESTVSFLYQALEDFSKEVQGKPIGVVGYIPSSYETVLRSYEIQSVMIEHHLEEKYDHLLYVVTQEEEMFSSREQPDQDLKLMRSFLALLNPGGKLFLSVPIGKETCEQNGHRVYGSGRLKRLLSGWSIQKVYGFESIGQPLFVLEPCNYLTKPTLWDYKIKPFITAPLLGQLGNHLFIVASLLSYAWDHDLVPLFPDWKQIDRMGTETLFDKNRDRSRDTIFSRLNTVYNDLPRPITQKYEESFPLPDPEAFEDVQVIGYLQRWSYFHHHRDKLLALFAPSQQIMTYLQNKYGELLSAPNTVSVHVRTADEKGHYGGSYFLGLEYYRKAMDLFPKDSLFVVFSDRINWCKKHFASFNKQMIFIEGNDHIEDLFLMSKMKSLIIANSTFSWWAAYLNPQAHKVVAPRVWYHPFRPAGKYFYFPSWTLVDADLQAPYPSDIRNYDKRSESIDNQ